MKKILNALFFILAGYLPSLAQTANGVPIKDLKSEYIQIVGTAKLLSSKITIDIDFGQIDKAFVIKDTEIRDENGKPVFNSMIDALNFMSANGYDFVQAYTMQDTTSQSTCFFLLKKRREKMVD